MTPGRIYLVGLGGAGVVAALCALLVGGAPAGAIWLALGAALVVQGPMGWWLVRSIGRPEMVTVWTMGMLARLGTLALVGLLLLPALHLPLAPGLLALAALLVALLAVEIFAVWTRTRTGRE